MTIALLPAKSGKLEARVVNRVIRISVPEAIFFDVDGVLIDSLDIKGEALAETFHDFPNSHHIVTKFHYANGGVTRTKKIAELYRLLAGVDATELEIEERSAKFGAAVQQRVIDADEIAGAETALRWWTAQCPLYAVSATPSAELDIIVAARGMALYFSGVYGWPPSKDRVIEAILATQGYVAKRCILIGDSEEDLLASRRAGVHFVHVKAPTVKVLPGKHQTIADMHGLNSAISMALGDQPI